MPEFMMTMINTFLMNLSDNTNFILIQMNEKRKKKITARTKHSKMFSYHHSAKKEKQNPM